MHLVHAVMKINLRHAASVLVGLLEMHTDTFCLQESTACRPVFFETIIENSTFFVLHVYFAHRFGLVDWNFQENLYGTPRNNVPRLRLAVATAFPNFVTSLSNDFEYCHTFT